MKVLMITGDKNIFIPGTSAETRFALQRGAVEKLEAVYWGPGAWCPELPEESFDVVTAQDPFWRGLFAWHVARGLRAKLNIQVHTDLSAYSFMRRVLAGVVLRSADSVRVVSEKIKKQVEKIGVRAQISVLPIYVDVRRFHERTHLPQTKKTILWVGRFEYEKNPVHAIHIFEKVLAAGIDARLVMLGSGVMEDALRKLAMGLPAGSVEFPGWQDPADYVAEADVVVSTSRHESFGASMIEALAAGLPVVAPDVGVAREAGARIAERQELPAKVIEVLRSGERGFLKMPLLTAEEWVTQWKESLI